MKCKYCGYEYSKGVIKFCPNCGSSLINNEGNGFELKKEADVVREKSNDGNVSKEEVAATAATIPEKDGNIIKRFWRKFYDNRVSIGVLLSLILVFLLIFEEVSGVPVHDVIFGTDDNDIEVTNRNTDNQYDIEEINSFVIDYIEFYFPYLHSICDPISKRDIEFWKSEELSNAIYDIFIVTVHASITSLEHIGEQKIDYSFPIGILNKTETSSESLENTEIEIFPYSFWGQDNNCFSEIDALDNHLKKLVKSRRDLLYLICENLEAQYNAMKSDGIGIRDYLNTKSYYTFLGSFLYDTTQLFFSDTEQTYPIDDLINCIEINYDLISDKFPGICKSLNDYYDDEDYYEDNNYNDSY